MTTMPKTQGLSETLRSGTGTALSDRGGWALANAAEAWIATTVECQRNVMDFISMRLDKDGETFRAMMACKNPADVSAIQSRWMEETLRDYASEMSKLTTIYTRLGRGGAGPKG